jgi:hypothetical protein
MRQFFSLTNEQTSRPYRPGRRTMTDLKFTRFSAPRPASPRPAAQDSAAVPDRAAFQTDRLVAPRHPVFYFSAEADFSGSIDG